jgi:L-alanine-DL-glutamate epimerase-like enolase superfamily enzyme
MSMAANKTFVPHSPNPSMLDVFALSMLAAVPNAFSHMEYDAINTKHPPDGTDFFAHPVYEIRDGAIAVPTGLGWGVELRSGLLTDATNQTSTKA